MARADVDLVALFLSAALQAPAEINYDMTFTPTQIVAKSEELDGRHVRVRGYVVITSHAQNIFDSKSDYEGKGGVCLGLSGSRLFLSPLRSREEVVSGIYKRNLCGRDDVCLSWCSPSGIIADNK